MYLTTPRHAIPRHAIPRHATPYHTTPHHTTTTTTRYGSKAMGLPTMRAFSTEQSRNWADNTTSGGANLTLWGMLRQPRASAVSLRTFQYLYNMLRYTYTFEIHTYVSRIPCTTFIKADVDQGLINHYDPSLWLDQWQKSANPNPNPNHLNKGADVDQGLTNHGKKVLQQMGGYYSTEFAALGGKGTPRRTAEHPISVSVRDCPSTQTIYYLVVKVKYMC